MNDCLIRKNDKGYIEENIYLSLLFLSGPDTFFHSTIRAFVLYFNEITATKNLLILSSFTSHRVQ